MNSYENPSLSYECDLTAERDRLREINKKLLATINEAAAWNDADLEGIDDITPNEPMLKARRKVLRAAIARAKEST